MAEENKDGLTTLQRAMFGDADPNLEPIGEKPVNAAIPLGEDGKPIVEQPETKPETKPEPTPKEEPKPDTEKPAEVDPVTKLFQEQGLDKQFKDVNDLIVRTRERNAYITRLEQERAEDRRLIAGLSQRREPTPKPEPTPKVKVTPDMLLEDPETALDNLNVARRGDVTEQAQRLKQLEDRIAKEEQRRESERCLTFIEAQPELKDVAEAIKHGTSAVANNVWDRIEHLYDSKPGLQSMPFSEALPLLFNAVVGENARNGGGVATTPVATVDPAKKVRASTTPGKTAPQPSNKEDRSYWQGKSIAEMEKEIGYDDK